MQKLIVLSIVALCLASCQKREWSCHTNPKGSFTSLGLGIGSDKTKKEAEQWLSDCDTNKYVCICSSGTEEMRR